MGQLKRKGKIEDGFICLPDPEDVYTWYYIVFGLDYKEYNGGYYMGKIVCPEDYPAKAPRIYMLTDNGRFKTDKTGYADGICLSVSYYHPESWNPVWKVNQIVIGLVSFWCTEESTAGSYYRGELPVRSGETESDVRMTWAKQSREKVLAHEKFHIFKDYADAMGINNVPEVEAWKAHEQKMADIQAKLDEQKRIQEEKRDKLKRKRDFKKRKNKKRKKKDL